MARSDWRLLLKPGGARLHLRKSKTETCCGYQTSGLIKARGLDTLLPLCGRCEMIEAKECRRASEDYFKRYAPA
jgi:hypothetical protein